MRYVVVKARKKERLMTHSVEILDITPITRNVRHFARLANLRLYQPS